MGEVVQFRSTELRAKGVGELRGLGRQTWRWDGEGSVITLGNLLGFSLADGESSITLSLSPLTLAGDA